MSTEVFLHIGLPKSGTSYLQRLLTEHKSALQDRAGLLFPGRSWDDQVMAVRDVRGMGGGDRVAGAWQRLVDEVQRWPGRAVVSMEWLCSAEPRVVRRIAADLEPATVQVVVTVRDLGRTLPAAWQEFVQNRSSWTWEEFLAGVTDLDAASTAAGRAFWSQQDAPRLVDRWASVVTPDRVHLLTLPQPGAPRDLLWQRVSRVLDIDPTVVVPGLPATNESLGLESAELMRRVNARSRDLGVARPEYNRVFKHHLAKGVLAARRAEESALAVPDRLVPWLEERAALQRSALALSGAHIVGDLDELQPVLVDGKQPADVPDAAVLDAAVAALVALARQRDKDVTRASRRRRRSRRRTPSLPDRPGTAQLARYGRWLVRQVRVHTSASASRRS